VLDAPGADVLVVVGVEADTPVAAVVAGAAAGLDVRAVRCYDGSRLVGDVVLDDVRGVPLDLDPARVRDGSDLQQALLAAESVGAADACLAMARDYAIDRVAFGRPIGSYQAIKHKLVEMLRRVELGRSALVGAGRAWLGDRERFAVMANAARVTAVRGQDLCAAENVFVHGGVGATWEHDASVLYRRAEHARRLAGGVEAAADRVAGGLLAAAQR
jgi:alkylation response protein AidB-like acyl-CoA dehydrogenase